ncbi:MAG: YqeG family HAD IIIA-type phosphatase [Bacilli bacterium]|nr:YqeG family HAD IIIA-type phosphatase [Bacilli bacterium]
MNKIFIPTYLAKSIYDLDAETLKSLNIKTVLSDLDNTLASFRSKDADQSTLDYINSLKGNGINFYIASNNTSERVKRFASTLGIKALSGLAKPLSKRLKKLLKEEGLDLETTVLIGDQIMTDVIAGNGAGIRTILCEKLVPEDPPWTRFNRIFERGKRKKINKNKLAPRIKEED